MRDSEDIVMGKGVGFRCENGKTAMIQCFGCGKAITPTSGICADCGHDANSNHKEGQ